MPSSLESRRSFGRTTLLIRVYELRDPVRRTGYVAAYVVQETVLKLKGHGKTLL